MKTVSGFVLLVLACSVDGDDLILGISGKNTIYHTEAKYYALPFIKRDKDIFFSSPTRETITKIEAFDMLHSKAQAIVTAGGIGQSYVNIHLTSERGHGLMYDITIYS